MEFKCKAENKHYLAGFTLAFACAAAATAMLALNGLASESQTFALTAAEIVGFVAAFTYASMRKENTVYELRNRLLSKSTGVLSREWKAVKTSEVESFEETTSALQGLFGVTSLHVGLAGGRVESFSDLSFENKEKLKKAIEESMKMGNGASRGAD